MSQPNDRSSVEDVLHCLEGRLNSSRPPSLGVVKEPGKEADSWGSASDSSGMFPPFASPKMFRGLSVFRGHRYVVVRRRGLAYVVFSFPCTVAPSSPEHLTVPGVTEQNDDPGSPTNGSFISDIRPRGGPGVSPVDVFQDQFKPSQYTWSHSFTDDCEKQQYPGTRPSVEGRHQRPYPAPSGFAEARIQVTGV